MKFPQAKHLLNASLHHGFGSAEDGTMQKIGKIIYEQLGHHIDYVVAGSFAAAVVASQSYGEKQGLPYNDVDVWVWASQLPDGVVDTQVQDKDLEYLDCDILQVRRINNAFFDGSISLNLIVLAGPDNDEGGIDIERVVHLLKRFDINAVQASVLVRWNRSRSKWEKRFTKHSIHFRAFLTSDFPELEIVNEHEKKCIRSFIRLLQKSAQFELPFKLPPKSGLRSMVDEAKHVSSVTVDKWLALPLRLRDSIGLPIVFVPYPRRPPFAGPVIFYATIDSEKDKHFGLGFSAAQDLGEPDSDALSLSSADSGTPILPTNMNAKTEAAPPKDDTVDL